jgi:tripartite ATP-independent transporter DctM subunit
MSREILAGTGHHAPREKARTGAIRFFNGGENLVLAVALGSMALLPIAESALRFTFRTAIPGSNAIVQHLTLVVGMLGAAVAARERRLLSLSTGVTLLPARFRAAARLFSGTVATAITSLLCIASVQFVVFETQSEKMLVGAVPIWVPQAVLPLGFGLVALRILWHVSERWAGRVTGAALAGLIVWLGALPPLEPADLVVPGLAALVVATLLGAPVFTALGGAALILFWGAEVPIAAIPVETYRMVVSPTLPTIPLFTLAGYFLAEGGASKRLLRVFLALAGWLRGGPVIVTALVCAFFTSFTGASGVTILALGGLLMPVLLSARYTERNSLGLLTAAGSLGLLFPPSLPVILYGIVSHTPIDTMFMGCFIPGLLLVGLTAWWGIRQGRRAGVTLQPFTAREAARAVWEAKWELLLPFVVLAGIFGGFATLVEAAALTALYAFVVETFIYRDLRLFRDVPRVIARCGTLVGGVLIILGVALGFTNYLVDAEIPARAVEWVKGAIESPLLFLLLLNIFLLLVGCLMDIFSAIVVVVPLIIPMGEAFGIHPVHLGVIFLANLELGYLTPPVGMNLFLSSYRFDKPLPEVYRSVIPMLLVLFVGVLLITYVPQLTMMLPRLFGR